MKHILGIIGSPRKNGNTDVLVSEILGNATSGGAETESVMLGGLTIRECDGCHACWKTGECAKHDDMISLYRAIERSDVIVFGTPVYWYGPTALMKAFIDRLVFFNCPENRRKIVGKKAVAVIPFEENNPSTADLTVEMFKRSFEYLELTFEKRLIVPGVTLRGEVRYRPEYMEQAAEIGKELSE